MRMRVRVGRAGARLWHERRTQRPRRRRRLKERREAGRQLRSCGCRWRARANGSGGRTRARGSGMQRHQAGTVRRRR
eukprot:6187378-Pleurochrysis_carterae.AAC.1